MDSSAQGTTDLRGPSGRRSVCTEPVTFGRGLLLIALLATSLTFVLVAATDSPAYQTGPMLDVWYEETRFLSLGMISSYGPFHSLLFLSGQTNDPVRWSLGFAVGGSLYLDAYSQVQLDFLTQTVFRDRRTKDSSSRYAFRVFYVWEETRGTSFFVGPTLSYLRTRNEEDEGREIVPWSLSHYRHAGRWHSFWRD